jgi:hypothetical protein
LHGSKREKVFHRFGAAFPDYSLRAFVFPVVREKGRRDLYLRSCPIVIGRRLGEAVGGSCKAVIIVSDTDFDGLAPGSNAASKRPTEIFLEELVSELGSRMAGRRLRASCKAGVVELEEGGVRVAGRVGSRSDGEVQAADLALGLFVFGEKSGRGVRNVSVEQTIRG